MNRLEYCKSWFWGHRMTNNPITAKEARKRHDKRAEYTVLVGGAEHPLVVILLVKTLVAISFPDKLLRGQLEYHYSEKEPGRLLLSMAVRRVYCPATPEMIARMEAGRQHPDQPWSQFLADADRVLDGRSVKFSGDGKTFYGASRHGDARRLDLPGPIVDMSSQWEPYPEFGQYEHLLKRDRGVVWGPGVAGP